MALRVGVDDARQALLADAVVLAHNWNSDAVRDKVVLTIRAPSVTGDDGDEHVNEAAVEHHPLLSHVPHLVRKGAPDMRRRGLVFLRYVQAPQSFEYADADVDEYVAIQKNNTTVWMELQWETDEVFSLEFEMVYDVADVLRDRHLARFLYTLHHVDE
eukprot:3501708-Rhodomonas_salina.1